MKQQQTNSPPEEVLPIGVGRIPQWWMEITPHYTLDLEEEEARRALEDQMSFYYSQMAAADDAGMLGPDGKPKLGPDGKSLTSSSWGSNGWEGRGAGGSEGAAGGATGPDGRRFAPGTAVINPALFGIDKSDPDYKNYLTGAKLPPGYLEKMADFAAHYHANNPSHSGGEDGTYNNLAQTDYGRYGRQAETPAFQPTWAKLKLRSTNHGSALRHGIDAEPPEKGGRRVADTTSAAPIGPMAPPPPLQQEPPKPEPPKEEVKSEKPKPKEGKLKRMVRKVRRVKKDPSDAAEPVAKAAAKPKATQAAYAASDYIVQTKEQPEQARPRVDQEQAPMPRVAPEQAPMPRVDPEQPPKPRVQPSSPVQQSAPPMQEYYPESEDEYEEEYEEEEIIEEEFTEYEEEEIMEEEIIEEVFGEPPQKQANLMDLQAILAAKQAELMRLQAQM
jgi:hypothetical protein